MLALGIDATDISRNDTQADEDTASDEPDGQHQRRPALHTITSTQGNNHIDQDDKADEKENETQVEDETQWLHAE